MTRIAIGGAGGFAREAAAAVRECAARGAAVELAGFLDDDPALRGARVDGTPVLGGFDDVAALGDAQLVIATGRPDNYTSRRALVARCGLPASRYGIVVHPSAALA